MSNAFRIYRKRLDLVNFNIDVSYEHDGQLVEETLVVNLRRPDTVQALQLTETIMRLGRTIDARSEMFDPKSYAQASAGFAEFVHSIDGLKDEDNADIKWADLSKDEQIDIFNSLPMWSIFQLGNALIEAGRLSPDKKKSSVNTSPTSTSAAPVAVPSVPVG